MTDRPLPTLRDVLAAGKRLSRHLPPTPLRTSEWLSAATAARVDIKIESVQPTHSFKIRGAMNAALRLIEPGDAPPPIVTASAGNHGRALALAASRFGLRVTIFTPSSAPATKKDAIRRLGVLLRDEATDYDEAEHLAREYASRSGGLYISPYNHPDVIAGAGTIALEILADAPDVQTVVVPLGGGGLASGIAVAMRSAKPDVTIIGVEVNASRPFATALERGAITMVDVRPSLADGLIGNLEPASITFDLVRDHVTRLVSVSEDDLRRAIRGLAREEHLISEGAGATATAAVLHAAAVSAGQRAVVLVTGANIDLTTYTEIISS